MIVWIGVLFMALMGFLDDYIKVRKRHNRGIFWKQKNYITMTMSFVLAWVLMMVTGIDESISLLVQSSNAAPRSSLSGEPGSMPAARMSTVKAEA
mgnify:CR=1 FL=1